MNSVTIRLVERALKQLPQDNPIAGTVKNLIRQDGVTCEHIRKAILFLGQLDEKKIPDQIKQDTDESVIKDYRFQRLLLHGFHKFPYRTENSYYSLPFYRDKKNCSCIYVGSNGSGKTSLFSAIEFLCTGQISATHIHNIEIPHYIPHAGIGMEQVDIQIETNKGIFARSDINQGGLMSIRPYLAPFFYSESDTMRMAESTDITAYIIQQSELKEMKDLIDKIEQIYESAVDAQTYIDSQTTDASDPNKELQLMILLSLYEDCARMLLSSDAKNKRDAIVQVVRSLKKPLRFTQISSNAKEERRNLQLKKAMEDVKELSEFINAEYEQLTSLPISFGNFIFNDYRQIIDQFSQILHLYEQTNQVRESEDLQSKDALRIVRQYRTALLDLLNIYKQVDTTHFSEIRSLVATVLSDLCTSIKNGESFSKYSQRYHEKVEEFQNSIRLEQENAKEKQQRDHLVYLLPHLEMFYHALINEYNLYIKYTFRVISATVHSILENYNFKNEGIKIEETEGKIAIRYQFNQSVSFEPKQYLNSFRFKLYTLCIKVSLAFAVMKNLNLRFPLVFDDVFYSSDFINRERVREFIQSLFELYSKHVSAEDNALQIIFFTHDEVVMEAAKKGIPCTGIPYLYGRIFPYQEMENENNKQCEMNKSIYPLCVIF